MLEPGSFLWSPVGYQFLATTTAPLTSVVIVAARTRDPPDQ